MFIETITPTFLKDEQPILISNLNELKLNQTRFFVNGFYYRVNGFFLNYKTNDGKDINFAVPNFSYANSFSGVSNTGDIGYFKITDRNISFLKKETLFSKIELEKENEKYFNYTKLQGERKAKYEFIKSLQPNLTSKEIEEKMKLYFKK